MGQLLSSPSRARHRKDQSRQSARSWSSETRVGSAGTSTFTRVGSAADGRNGKQPIPTQGTSFLDRNEEPRRKKDRIKESQRSRTKRASDPDASFTSRGTLKRPEPRLDKADHHERRPRQSTRTKSRASKNKLSIQVTELKDCIVCTNTRSINRFPARSPTASCTHEPDVCRRCLRTWIHSEFTTKIWNEISCPVCLTQMSYDDVQAFASHDTFRRYNKLSKKAAFEAIPNFRWCIARGCKNGQVHDPSSARFRCRRCKKSHCVHHEGTWHRGETCQEYDYRTDKSLKRAEEMASKMCIQETTKKCPGCRRSIEKSFGCDHMTCSRCRHEFCWQCLAPYLKKGARRVVHAEGCEYNDPQWEMML